MGPKEGGVRITAGPHAMNGRVPGLALETVPEPGPEDAVVSAEPISTSMLPPSSVATCPTRRRRALLECAAAQTTPQLQGPSINKSTVWTLVSRRTLSR